jgi:hypothetical protein
MPPALPKEEDMSDSNLYNVNAHDAAMPPVSTDQGLGARLNEHDRRAIDYLLEGAPGESDTAPMVRALDRVNAARRLLGLLDNLPSEEPSASLLDATLARLPK